MSEPIPRVDPRFIGAEALTDEDRHYQGSRFQDVRDAIFANPYYSTWGAVDEPPLPIFRAPLCVASRAVVKRHADSTPRR